MKHANGPSAAAILQDDAHPLFFYEFRSVDKIHTTAAQVHTTAQRKGVEVSTAKLMAFDTEGNPYYLLRVERKSAAAPAAKRGRPAAKAKTKK